MTHPSVTIHNAIRRLRESDKYFSDFTTSERETFAEFCEILERKNVSYRINDILVSAFYRSMVTKGDESIERFITQALEEARKKYIQKTGRETA